MREREIRVLRDTLKTLDEMQRGLDAANAAIRALICYGHEEYVPCPQEAAAYKAERDIYDMFKRPPVGGINREPTEFWKNQCAVPSPEDGKR